MITAILIGAGGRGIGAYGNFALKNPNDIKFVGSQTQDAERREYFAFQHGISRDNQFVSYEDILAVPKFAEVCFVCTQDTMHVEPNPSLYKGISCILGEPMAVSPTDVVLLQKIAKKYERKLMIGHVLRYTLFSEKIKEIIDAGTIGKIMTIQHNENVSYWHQAHSYVRGNWHKTATSAPMILAKSCHDLDILMWLADTQVSKVSSFGNLTYFTENNAPKDAPKYCLDGCPHKDNCAYYAPKVYLNAPDWMKLPVSNQMTEDSILEKLKKGPYGRCVFHSDNDVVDHQVVILEFINQMTASFTMTAFTSENTRTIKVMGTLGEIRGHMDKGEVALTIFKDEQKELFKLNTLDYGHSGGDYGIMKAFVRLIEVGDNQSVTSDQASVQSHLLAFAAEESRLSGHTIDFEKYIEKVSHHVKL